MSLTWVSQSIDCVDAMALVTGTSPIALTRATMATLSDSRKRASRRLGRCGMRPSPSESLTRSPGWNRRAVPTVARLVHEFYVRSGHAMPANAGHNPHDERTAEVRAGQTAHLRERVAGLIRPPAMRDATLWECGIVIVVGVGRCCRDDDRS